MAVLKYKSTDGSIKTLGASYGSISQNYGVTSVNGKTGDVTIDIQVIKSAVLTFTFSAEDSAHICSTSIVNNIDKVLDIIPYNAKLFRGGINYDNGYLFTAFLDGNGSIYAQPIECRVIYYE